MARQIRRGRGTVGALPLPRAGRSLAKRPSVPGASNRFEGWVAARPPSQLQPSRFAIRSMWSPPCASGAVRVAPCASVVGFVVQCLGRALALPPGLPHAQKRARALWSSWCVVLSKDAGCCPDVAVPNSVNARVALTRHLCAPPPASADWRAAHKAPRGFLPFLMVTDTAALQLLRPVTTFVAVVTGRPSVRPRAGCATAADRLAASRAHRSAVLRAPPSTTALDAPGRIQTWACGASPGHQRQRDKTPSRTRRSAARRPAMLRSLRRYWGARSLRMATGCQPVRALRL